MTPRPSIDQLGLSDPPPTEWFKYAPTRNQLLVALFLGAAGVTLMWVGTTSRGSAAGVISLAGISVFIAALVLLFSSWRDVRAKDSARRLERRMERLIELEMEQLEVTRQLLGRSGASLSNQDQGTASDTARMRDASDHA